MQRYAEQNTNWKIAEGHRKSIGRRSTDRADYQVRLYCNQEK